MLSQHKRPTEPIQGINRFCVADLGKFTVPGGGFTQLTQVFEGFFVLHTG